MYFFTLTQTVTALSVIKRSCTLSDSEFGVGCADGPGNGVRNQSRGVHFGDLGAVSGSTTNDERSRK